MDPQRWHLRRLDLLSWVTHLWAPLGVFLFAFIPYVALIEFRRDAYRWSQPLMKDLSVLMLAWFGCAVVLRYVILPRSRVWRLRQQAAVLIGDAQELVLRSDPDPQLRQGWTQQVARVEAARISGDVAVLEPELKSLGERVEQLAASGRGRSSLIVVMGFVKALAIALLVRTVVVEPFKIPSGSMIPTLEIGDQVFVNKFIYGVRIPWLNKVPFVLIRPPQRGDVIVFNNPVDVSRDFIKRVIGIPGDSIEIVDEVVQVNGQPQPRQPVSDHFTMFRQERGGWVGDPEALYEETVGGVAHATLQRRFHPKGSMHEGPYVVPAGTVFVMGDNRDNSLDSRYGFGVTNRTEYVPYGYIKGKAMVIWLSLSHGGLGSGLFGGTGLRIDRLFLPVR